MIMTRICRLIVPMMRHTMPAVAVQVLLVCNMHIKLYVYSVFFLSFFHFLITRNKQLRPVHTHTHQSCNIFCNANN